MNRRAITLIAALSVLGSLGCEPDSRTFPASLDGPRDIAVVKGDVCLDSFGGTETRVVPVTRECNPARQNDEGEPVPAETGDVGLVASEQNNRVGVIDMSRVRPRLVDLDPSEPGVSHIPVGRAPVAVAAGPGGNAGYALNQIDKTISPINLWWLRASPDDAIDLPRTPRHMVVSPGFNTSIDDQTVGEPDRLVVALARPSALWIRDGVSCPKPDGVGTDAFDRLDPQADVGCSPPNDDSVETVPLPDGVSAMELNQDGSRLYVAYRNQGYLSVIGLDARATADGSACTFTNATPCELDRIELGAPCSDGLDSDGDGLIDQRDPQCYGPFDDEAPADPNAPGPACSDAVDNDGDGLVDRDDPDCAYAGDDSEAEQAEPIGTRACSDGADNDGDGLVDWPDDPDCYGERGRSERDTGLIGVESIGVGPMERFVYVANKANTELLVIDAQRGKLFDARNAEPGDRRTFIDDRGIEVSAYPSAVEGRIERSVFEDPDCAGRESCDHGVIRYDFGAFVASDSSRIDVVNAATAFCEVYETDSLLSNREFFERGAAFENSRERECLEVPEFPQPEDPDADACQAVRSCQACLDSETACQTCREDPPEEGCSQVCAAVGENGCTDECENFVDNEVECRASGRLRSSPLVRVAFNPEFELQDSLGRNAQVSVGGSCETPSELLEAAREQDANPSTECSAPFRPQPLALQTPELDDTTTTVQRATLRRDATLGLEFAGALRPEFRDPDIPLDAVQSFAFGNTDDYTIRSETWTVAWEGVIPGTNRDDAVIDADQPGLLEMGGADMCNLGVMEGDRLTIRNQPDVEGGPEICASFDEEELGFRTWRIAEVRPRELVLEVIDAAPEQGEFADELPRRDCFARAIDYEIRPNGEWLAYGNRTGYLSPRESFEGRCIQSENAVDPRFSSRVRTGEVYRGPYLSFELREGRVDPVRSDTQELRYNFRVERNFTADRITTNTIFPRAMFYDPLLRGGPIMMVPDASGDFIFIRNRNDRDRPNGYRIR
jgi:hypothetical protein